MLIHLKAHNGQYVCAENGGGQEVNANRDYPAQWESFEVGGSFQTGGQVSFRTYNLRNYLQADGGGGGALTAKGPWAEPWETFTIIGPGGDTSGIPISNGAKISLRTDNGHFVCAEEGGGQEVNATRTAAAGWEIFTVEFAPVATHFKFRLDSFRIYKTRSLHNDTVYVSLAAGAKTDPEAKNEKKFFGDLNDGDYHVGIESDVLNGSNGIAVTYSVWNQGSRDSKFEEVLKKLGDWGISQGKKALDGPATQALATVPYVGPILVIAAPYMTEAAVWLSNVVKMASLDFLFGGCDGLCAFDKIIFDLATLQQLTVAGPYTETRKYSFESQPGCGGSGQYTVTWSIEGV